MSDRLSACLALILMLFNGVPLCIAQQPAAREEQETVKVYTEEVRLPVVAYDDRERFDPTLAADDVLVLEDGVPQHVRSVRRVPANVLLVFDMGGQVTSTGAANATREAALRFIARLGEGNRVALIQTAARRPELLLDWTTDASVVNHALKTKLFSAPRSRLSECLALAAAKLSERPVGNTHVVVFTDGLEAQSRDEIRADDVAKDVVRSLVAAQASVHLFGFSSLVGQAVKYRKSMFSGGVIDLDFQMRRWFRKYEQATKKREGQLLALAREAGGRVLLPTSPEEVPALAEKVARDIGAQYVVTYRPLRPFVEGGVGERRRAEVSARRMGLQLFTLRSVVTAPQTAIHDEK